MRNVRGILSLLALFSAGAIAQDKPPVVDVFVGYSFLRVGPSQDVVPSFSANGGIATLTYNFTTDVGIESEFSGYHSGNINNVQLDTTNLTYLFGPRWSIGGRSRQKIPYLHVLWGVSHTMSSLGASSPLLPTQPIAGAAAPSQSASQTAPAFAAGGGIDFKWKNFIIRPAQLDYYLTAVQVVDLLVPSTPGSSLVVKTQSSFRFAAGIAFTFGSR